MDTHVRQFGILTIVFSVAGLVLGLALLAFYDGAYGLLQATDSTGFGPVLTGLILFNMVLAIPAAVTAHYVMRYQSWARNVMIVICGLNVLNVPLGSILAAYGFWVLMTPETEPLFLSPLPRAAARQKSGPPPAQAETGKPKPIVPSKADLQS